MPVTQDSEFPEIGIGELTEISTTGNGVFDQLMQATKAHLEHEFNKGRIKGPEYAQVYLGSVQAVLERSMQFLMEQQSAHLQAQLLAEQIKGQQEQNALLRQQILNAEAEGLNIPKQGEVLDKQVCKLNAEFDLISEQVLKTTQETSLLAQKKVTEKAQTDSTGIDPESVIGKQKQLYAAQTKGYGQDARNKAAKLLVDTWNVRRTTDSGTVAGYDEEEGGTDNKLGDKDIAAAIDRMSEGL